MARGVAGCCWGVAGCCCDVCPASSECLEYRYLVLIKDNLD